MNTDWNKLTPEQRGMCESFVKTDGQKYADLAATKFISGDWSVQPMTWASDGRETVAPTNGVFSLDWPRTHNDL